MDIERTAGIVILVLNLAGLVFLLAVGLRALFNRYMNRFESIEIDDEDLFQTPDDPVEPPPPVEKSPEPPKKQAPLKKPEFNLDDFDFDL